MLAPYMAVEPVRKLTVGLFVLLNDVFAAPVNPTCFVSRTEPDMFTVPLAPLNEITFVPILKYPLLVTVKVFDAASVALLVSVMGEPLVPAAISKLPKTILAPASDVPFPVILIFPDPE